MLFRLLSKSVSVSVLVAASGLSVAHADKDTDPGAVVQTGLDRVVVVGELGETADLGGSVQYLDEEALDTHAATDIHRILRQTPGVYLQEEEGYGLRPNIGIRGSGSDRNSRITVMEDGILIAPAPYAAPAAYYFPRMARISGVEVAKGPASVMYGPLTTGGALNLFSAPIPDVLNAVSGRFDALTGTDNALRLRGLAGGWLDVAPGLQMGAMVDVLHEQSDGFKTIDVGGDTGFEVSDVVARLGLRTGPDATMPQSLEFKFQTSDETSDETYLGLTLDDFRANPTRRYNGSQVDEMNVRHDTYQLTHRIDFTPDLDLTTIVYRNETARAWYKLNDVRNSANTGWVSLSAVLDDPATFADQYAVLVGADGFASSLSPGGDLRVRNNNRTYAAQGVQSVLGMQFDTGPAAHTLLLSARYHEDDEDRYQQDDRYHIADGLMTLVTPGAPGSQDNRIGSAEAWAFFVRDTIEFGDWIVVPGVRYETIDLTRTNYGTANPNRTIPPAVVDRNVDIWIPGVSATYKLGDDWRLFAGAHRGFSSPAPGSTVDPETSWNYEAGVRYASGEVSFEVVGYFNDYDNLVGTCTASTGGGCNIGDQFEGGAVEVRGLELMAGFDAGVATGWGVSVPLSLVYTFTDTEFGTSFASAYEPWGAVAAGDELPYTPEHQLTLNAGLVGDNWRLNLAANHVSEARATAGSGSIASSDRIDARTLLDIAGAYDMTDNLSLFASVTNLTDEVYNVAFSPAGARPGAPQTLMAGIRTRF